MRKIFLSAIFIFNLCLCASAQRLEYKGIYAPSESWVKKEEKPYRQDLCLNGLWQFQPVALPDKFREGVDPTPVLPQVKNDAWDNTPIRIPSPWNVNSFADKNGQGGDFRCYPSYPKEWENIKMGWLKKIFTVPAGWKG
ncbi:MAG: glycoside hydrolase family 2, partial [Sediminibacterium sp.]|nr:glycoside hydrolase family 2 [Sediminibacterium sp.]